MPSNVKNVISDVEGVQDDLHDNVENAGRQSMRAVLADAKTNVKKDADWKGNLMKALSLDVDDSGESITFTVRANSEIAPYLVFVEYGTGSRTNNPWMGSLPPPPTDEGTRTPADFPYKSPSMSEGLVSSIIEWVKTKESVIPAGNMTEEQVGFAIAATIAEKGTHAHPFLRPAWFHNEHQVKRNIKIAVRRAFR